VSRQNQEKNCREKLVFNNQIWRISDVAGFLKCSEGHIYNLVYKKRIPYRKKGRLLFFLPSEIMQWIEEE